MLLSFPKNIAAVLMSLHPGNIFDKKMMPELAHAACGHLAGW
jgi:hypothetical protein